MLIHWKERAEIEIGDVLEYIAQDSITAAYSVYDAIRNQVGLLSQYPEIGRTGRVKGTRELIITATPYIVAYRIKKDRVEILRVLHGSRKWNKRFPK
ncbi:type II toxin-antitoxin system RelE/ParE family toxin [Methylovulum psychrotolerans]|uniref:Type II toxin-antitoxin system RelE/ParE family toxin n=1 Tax=Methylovulum psychrotolerans TaxID=1704499 RepID=A0A1Z4C134_9GAMM|nr:type II toxin-antitoxin system RelE/ParE family toxin [Methylovulum psychrotolerans]ASF47246.1 type II toxin-antitoxin system mRNA interferase toxin, RelE/StbE family [Methylovulum psychrotolerans]POZ52188.1 type II toxin-antitoxin system RelE/ParE family toxin [Methylovulum psychrotolerans]